MKRILTYCSVALYLLVGATSLLVSESKLLLDETGLATHQQTSHNDRQPVFSTTDLFVSPGRTTEQTRLNYSFQSFSIQFNLTFSNAFRISYLAQIIRQRYLTGNTVFLQQSAFKQLDGYYLYHLCKLLI